MYIYVLVSDCSLEAEAYFAELQAQHDEFLSSFFEMGTPYTKLYSYSHVLNGFAVQLSPEKVYYIYYITSSP